MSTSLYLDQDTDLPFEITSDLQQIQILYYGDRMTANCNYFTPLTSLQVLRVTDNHLPHNRLSEIIQSVSSLPSLEFLDCSNNSAIFHPSFILPKSWPSALRHCDLSNNNLQYFDATSLFSCASHLNVLVLDNNLIMDVLVATAQRHTGLQRLSLCCNRLKHVPQVLQVLPALEYLNLNCNQIESLADLRFLTALQELGLGCNKLALTYAQLLPCLPVSNLLSLNLTGNFVTGLLPSLPNTLKFKTGFSDCLLYEIIPHLFVASPATVCHYHHLRQHQITSVIPILQAPCLDRSYYKDIGIEVVLGGQSRELASDFELCFAQLLQTVEDLYTNKKANVAICCNNTFRFTIPLVAAFLLSINQCETFKVAQQFVRDKMTPDIPVDEQLCEEVQRLYEKRQQDLAAVNSCQLF